jgi:hypothetical protein
MAACGAAANSTPTLVVPGAVSGGEGFSNGQHALLSSTPIAACVIGLWSSAGVVICEGTKWPSFAGVATMQLQRFTGPRFMYIR